MTIIQARVALLQRVLPEYRAPFFEQLGTACIKGFGLLAGSPRDEESIASASSVKNVEFTKCHNIHISRGKTYFCFQRGVLRWLEAFNPDVLIVEANPRYLSTPSAMNWMHFRRRPVIGWGLGASPAGGVESFLRSQFFKSLDAVICYSTTGAQQYVDQGFAPDKVFVAPNAVSARPNTPAVFRPAEFLQGKATLLFVGRLQERKRVDVLLQACALLPESHQPNLIVVGDGPDRTRLEEIASQVYPSAEFTGAKFNSELDQFFKRADLFVLPGTGGLAIQQAMSHGLPVIVGEADGTQSELVRPENGWVLSSSTPQALAELLKQALGNVKTLRQMGQSSYRVVTQEVNLEAMVEAFAKAIKSVL